MDERRPENRTHITEPLCTLMVQRLMMDHKLAGRHLCVCGGSNTHVTLLAARGEGGRVG